MPSSVIITVDIVVMIIITIIVIMIILIVIYCYYCDYSYMSKVPPPSTSCDRLPHQQP